MDKLKLRLKKWLFDKRILYYYLVLQTKLGMDIFQYQHEKVSTPIEEIQQYFWLIDTKALAREDFVLLAHDEKSLEVHSQNFTELRSTIWEYIRILDQEDLIPYSFKALPAKSVSFHDYFCVWNNHFTDVSKDYSKLIEPLKILIDYREKLSTNEGIRNNRNLRLVDELIKEVALVLKRLVYAHVR